MGIGLIYGAGWASVLQFTAVGYNPTLANRILPFEHYFLANNLLAFVLLFCVVGGWKVSAKLSAFGSKASKSHLALRQEQLHLYAWAIFLISFILRWQYVQAFGGFYSYLEYSALIRSSAAEIYNKWSFLQPFSGMAFFSTFLFLAAFLDKNKRLSVTVGFVLSLAFSLYVQQSLLGRMGFLMFLGTMILSFLYIKKIRPSIMMGFGVLGSALIIAAAYVISNVFEIKAADSLPEYISKELSFPFVSFFAQLDHGGYLFRFFVDFLVAPLYLLPSSLWTHWIDNVSEINTFVVMGGRKGDLGVTGGIPVDLMTLGLMQFHVFGIVGVGLLFGAMLRFLQGFCDGIHPAGLHAVILAYVAIRIAIFAIAYAHPHHLISGIFGIVFSIFLISAFSICTKIRLNR